MVIAMSQEQQSPPSSGDPGPLSASTSADMVLNAAPAPPTTAIYATPNASGPPTGPVPSTASSFISSITSTLASIPASLPSAHYPPTLDTILSQITGTSDARQSLLSLSNTLRNGLPKESRDAIMAGILPGGQDPLGALDVRHNTLGVLWIL